MKKRNENSVMLTVTVPRDVHKRCRLKLVEDDLTFAYLVRKAIFNYLGEEYDWKDKELDGDYF